MVTIVGTLNSLVIIIHSYDDHVSCPSRLNFHYAASLLTEAARGKCLLPSDLVISCDFAV